MIEKNNNFILGIVKSSLFFICIISFVTAINPAYAMEKGINIIKYENSCWSVPTHKDEIAVLMEKLNNATTEAEKTLIDDQLQEIEEEMVAWFKDRGDVEKGDKVREKLDLLTETLIEKISTKEGKEKLKKELPFSSIGYDYISYSLEVSIVPERFNDKDIKQYIKYIRKIVGSEIDLTISRQGYPTKSNFGAGVECNPAIGGNLIRTPTGSCTLGFKATYQGKIGFVTAGHCMEGTGKDVGQAGLFDKLGVSIFNSDSANNTFTNCDCAFVEITEEDRDIASKVFSGDSFGLLNTVKVVGRAASGVGRR